MTYYPLKWLLFNAKNNLTQVVIDCLSNPWNLTWPETPEEFSDIYQQLKTHLSSDILHLLDTSILSYVFLKKDVISDQVKQWVEKNLNCTVLLSGIAYEDALSARWCATPVVSVNSDNAKITYYLIGTLKKDTDFKGLFCPDWFLKCLKDDSKEAIIDGLKAATISTGINQPLYIFGLRLPGQNIIHGRSLCFPVGLGARAALTGKFPYKNCLATGDLIFDSDRIIIGKVGRISEKSEESNKTSASLFLYPYQNKTHTRSLKNPHSIPVNTFEEGWMWASLFKPENLEDLRNLETALRSKQDFFRTCDSLSPDCLEWAKNQPQVKKYLADIITKKEDLFLLNDLSIKLENCTKNTKGNYDQLFTLAALYNNPLEIETMAQIDPETALLFCSAHLALANHYGNNRLSDLWEVQGIQYQKKAQQSERGQRIFENFVNRCSAIAKRHNRYDFQSELPEIFINTLEKQEDINKRRSHPTDYALGSMYGTIAQNYAFCGHKYLKETRKFITLAQNAFGGGKQDNLKAHWKRQNSYLFFALLDAGKETKDEAGVTLLSLFGKDSWEDVLNTAHVDDLDPFLLFALSRAIADIPEIFPDDIFAAFVQKMWNFFSKKDFHLLETTPYNIHPWQLWCYNLGRILFNAREINQAVLAWNQSLELCLKGEETMQVMALLSLSQLSASGKMERKHSNIVSSVFDLIHSSKTLNKTKFKDIADSNNYETGLRKVFNKTEELFPFNYR